MMRRFVVKLILFSLIGVGLGLAFGPASQPVSAQPAEQEQNLLLNPSFEQPFVPDQRGDGGGFVAHGWGAWWYNDEGDEYDGPEFKQAKLADDPYRVRSGENAQQYFRAWALHIAGVYQGVSVPANSRVRFTIYGHAWSSWCDTSSNDVICDARDSSYGGGINPIAMKIGIDPTAGVDPFSPNIVWSEARGVYDNYEIFSVEATAQGDSVTVFTYSSPEWPAAVINVYWDDATLVVVGENPSEETPSESPPSQPSGDVPSDGIDKVDTQPAEEDGSQYHVVKAGETLIGIAVAYNVSVDAIRQLNGLTGDVIFVGQRLLIKEATAPETPEPEEEAPPPEEEPPAEEEVAEAPPVEAEEAPAPVGSQICLSLFDDANSDGLRQDGEPLLAGGILNISGVRSDSHQTDGVSEPFCFGDLDSGDYLVSVEPPEGYRSTGIERIPVTLSVGGQVTLSFGAAPADEAAAGEEEELPPDKTGASGTIFGVKPLIIVLGLLGVGLLLGGAGAATFVIVRRGQGLEEGEAEGDLLDDDDLFETDGTVATDPPDMLPPEEETLEGLPPIPADAASSPVDDVSSFDDVSDFDDDAPDMDDMDEDTWQPSTSSSGQAASRGEEVDWYESGDTPMPPDVELDEDIWGSDNWVDSGGE